MFYNINVYCIIFTQFTRLCEYSDIIQSTHNVYASHTVTLKVRDITTKNPEFTWFKQHWCYTVETITNNMS